MFIPTFPEGCAHPHDTHHTTHKHTTHTPPRTHKRVATHLNGGHERERESMLGVLALVAQLLHRLDVAVHVLTAGKAMKQGEEF